MGYHNNEATLKKAMDDAQRFINDRARLEFALRTTLAALGVDETQQTKVIAGVKAADLRGLHKLLKQPTGRQLTGYNVRFKEDEDSLMRTVMVAAENSTQVPAAFIETFKGVYKPLSECADFCVWPINTGQSTGRTE